MPRISLCMILRDEAPRLRRNLPAALEAADELVAVDTGSSDGTPAVLAELAGDRVLLKLLERPWDDDFAAARNCALEAAEGDWVLVLDADEELEPGAAARLRALAAEAPAEVWGWILDVRNYSDVDGDLDWRPLAPDEARRRGASGYFATQVVRLFRRDPRVRYRGRVHELVEPAIQDAGGRMAEAGVVLHHRLSARGGPGAAAKAARYLALQEAKAAEQPDSPKAWWELGREYLASGRAADAVSALERARELSPGVAEIVLTLATACLAAGRAKDALKLLDGLPRRHAGSRRAESLRASAQAALGRYDQARRACARALEQDPGNPRLACDLAILEAHQDHRAALRRIDDLARDRPDYAPVRAAEVAIRWDLARRSLAAGDRQAAGMELGRIVDLEPGHVPALVDLAGLHGDSGRPDMAERLLRQALLFDPDHALAHRNLAVAALLATPPRVEAAAAHLAAALNRGGRADPAVLARLQEAGRQPFPPVDWQPRPGVPAWVFVVDDAARPTAVHRAVLELADRLWERGHEVLVASLGLDRPAWHTPLPPVHRVSRDWGGEGTEAASVVVAAPGTDEVGARVADRAGAELLHLGEDLAVRSGERRIALPAGVDMGSFHPRPRAPEPDRRPVLGTVSSGGTFPPPGLDAAWPELAAEGWELLRVTRRPSPGRLPEGVTQLIQPDADNLVRGLRNMDVFVYLKVDPATALPPLEAMACGVPVVLVEGEAVRAYARPGENCLAVPFGDGVALLAAVRRLRAEPELRRHLVEAGLAEAEARPWDAAVEALVAAAGDAAVAVSTEAARTPSATEEDA